MKKLTFLIAMLLIYSDAAFAQVGFNNDGSQPDPSAGMDIKFSDKGLLIPRMALVQTTSASPVASPVVSLMVYNTASVNDVTPGYYYWSGTAWVKLSIFTGGSSTTNYVAKWTAAGTLGNSQIFDNGTNVGIGTTTPTEKLTVSTGVYTDAKTSIVAGGENKNSILYLGTPCDGLLTNPFKTAIIAEGDNTIGYSRAKLHFCLDNTNSNDKTNDASVSDAKMTIIASGNVGIGTTSPDFKTQIAQDIIMNTEIEAGSGQLALTSSSDPNKRMVMGYDNTGNGFGFIKTANRGIAWTNLVLLPNGGNVGIGTTTSPNQKLDVNGNIEVTNSIIFFNGSTVAGMKHETNDLFYIYNDNTTHGSSGVYLEEGGTSWINFSDARLKKNVESVNGILNDVCQLSVKRFHMNTDPDTMTKRLGFIAQDVQRLFPDLVHTDADYLSLSYSDFGVLSIEAIKELRAEKDAEIARLSQENAELNKKLESMQAQIDVIKGYLGISAVGGQQSAASPEELATRDQRPVPRSSRRGIGGRQSAVGAND